MGKDTIMVDALFTAADSARTHALAAQHNRLLTTPQHEDYYELDRQSSGYEDKARTYLNAANAVHLTGYDRLGGEDAHQIYEGVMYGLGQLAAGNSSQLDAYLSQIEYVYPGK
jgi:hypothetical protein